MSYISLYRKYRPKSFREVTGQEIIVRTLTNSIKSNKVGHAYIFAGPKGIGKTTIAKIFAKAVNCENPVDGDACNQCTNCQIISNNQTTDVIELDAASNNGVDEVRTIIDAIRFLPTSLKKKVYIIDEAHMLTTSAWNAMLKTVEEAPSHVIFIFATTEMHKIPATILSRAQHFLFNRLTHQQLKDMTLLIAKQEQIVVADDAVDKIIALADGSARDTLSILEQMAMYTNNQITLKDVTTVFGLVDLDHKLQLINLILQRDTKTIIQLLDEYAQNGINFAQLANDLTIILIDKLIYLQTQSIDILKILNEHTVTVIKLDQAACIRLINVWQTAFMKMRNASDARFYFELAVFNSFQNYSNNDVQPAIIVSKNPSQPPIDKTKESVAATTQKPLPPPIDKTEESITTTVKKPQLPIDKTKESVATTTKKPLPPINQIFTITPYVSDSEITNDSQKKTTKTTIDESLVFNQIAYNNSKKQLEHAKAFLTKIKTDNPTKILSFIASADKVLVTSENGMVLLYDDDVDAELLNAKNSTFDFLSEIKKYFNRPKIVLGLSKSKAKQLAHEFMILKKQGSIFNEPEITALVETLRANNSIEQMAFEIFGEK